MAERTRAGGSGKSKKTKQKGAPTGRRVPPRRRPKPPRSLDERAFHGELTAQGVLLGAAIALDRLAKRPGTSRLDVHVARALDALWLARRRNDSEALATWGRDAFTYLKTRDERERWSDIGLPPQAGLDRSGAMRMIVNVAKSAIALSSAKSVITRRREKSDNQLVGQMMADAVARLFPNLCQPHVDGSKYEARRAAIAARYEHLVNDAKGRGRVFNDADRLVAAALVAFGEKPTNVWNWLKGVPFGVIDGGVPATPPTEPPPSSEPAPPKEEE